MAFVELGHAAAAIADLRSAGGLTDGDEGRMLVEYSRVEYHEVSLTCD